MIQLASQLSFDVGKTAACESLQVPRATFYRLRDRKNRSEDTIENRPAPPLALKPQERQTVVDILHSERFLDDTPYEIYATLLDEGHYHCSIRTMCANRRVKSHSLGFSSMSCPIENADISGNTSAKYDRIDAVLLGT